MWLTGFDAPSLHTMYVDKPMRGHGLMQAITRVNRVFKDKPGGLVVDYLGLANNIREAHNKPSPRAAETGRVTINLDEAVEVLLEKYEICLRPLPGLRSVQLGRRERPRNGWGCCWRPRSTSWAKRTARNAACRSCWSFLRLSPWLQNRPEAQAISDDVGLFQGGAGGAVQAGHRRATP